MAKAVRDVCLRGEDGILFQCLAAEEVFIFAEEINTCGKLQRKSPPRLGDPDVGLDEPKVFFMLFSSAAAGSAPVWIAALLPLSQPETRAGRC
jgi:hypothetical protein